MRCDSETGPAHRSRALDGALRARLHDAVRVAERNVRAARAAA